MSVSNAFRDDCIVFLVARHRIFTEEAVDRLLLSLILHVVMAGCIVRAALYHGLVAAAAYFFVSVLLAFVVDPGWIGVVHLSWYAVFMPMFALLPLESPWAVLGAACLLDLALMGRVRANCSLPGTLRAPFWLEVIIFTAGIPFGLCVALLDAGNRLVDHRGDLSMRISMEANKRI